MGLDYVDIFYSHRFDPDTPLEETMGALASAVRQGKALYVGISSYSAGKTREAAAILKSLGVPLLIHQPSYSMLNRWIEPELLDALEDTGAGGIAFSPLAQGLLTDKYLAGVPEDSRINREGGGSLKPEHLNAGNLAHVRALNEIAKSRGQTLAQMAVAWVLRDPRVTSALIGASRPEQIVDLAGAVRKLSFSPEELAAIDQHAVEGGINLWQKPSTDQRPG
jgi:L-glyceraldehyde 3-phosphate reductase